MKYKLGWISWVALALLPISVAAVFYLFPWTQMLGKIINSDLRFSLMLPLAALASYTCIVFLVKSKTMSREYRLPWIMYSLAAFAFLLITIMTTVENSLIKFDPHIWNLSGIVFILSFLLLSALGMISEASKPSWKGRKSSISIFAAVLLALLVTYLFINRDSMAGNLVYTLLGNLSAVFFCVVIIQRAGQENISASYKVLLVGLVVALICSVLDTFFKNSNWGSISTIADVTCFIIATDIRTNIWLIEQK